MTIVSSGQTSNVNSGVTDTSWSVQYTGQINVLSGGKIISTADAGYIQVNPSGSANFTTISGASGALAVQDVYGVASGAIVQSSGLEIADSGGVVIGA